MDNPRRILIVQLKRAGDVLLTTPIAEVLKRRWPQARVDFLTDKPFAPLLANHPSIDAVHVYDRARPWRTWKLLRVAGYDAVFDFQSSPRSALAVKASGAAMTAGYRVPFWGHFYRQSVRRPGGSLTVVEGKASLIEGVTGPLNDLSEPKLVLTPEEKTWAKDFRKSAGGRIIIGLIATHRHTARQWPAESFAELARSLNQAGYAVWLFWGPGEQAYVEAVGQQAPAAQVIPLTTLRQMAALLAECDVVATNDNGPMHIAAAVGTPTVTIYGPTDPHAWNPGGSRHTVVQAADVTCLGCNLNRCPFGHECMTHVQPGKMLSACQALLARAPKAALV